MVLLTTKILNTDGFTMTTMTFEAFEKQSLSEGYNEVLKKVWEPSRTIEVHTHPFGVHVVVAEGEMWLTRDGVRHHMTAGTDFKLSADEPHAEEYGPQGATFWVARAHPSSSAPSSPMR